MRKFEVRNPVYGDKVIAYLYYDEISREYKMELLDNVKFTEAPPILSEFIEKGQKEIGNEWSKRWVQQRVVPPERQNIGQILRENGMQFFDEFPLLIKNNGRSCQDECYLVEV